MQDIRHDKAKASLYNGADFSRAPATISIIITTFNHARFLADAIKSALAQTQPADEIIVVDDGSTDNPEHVLAQFPTIPIIRTENRGPSAARNEGLRRCTTSHVIFLDADDRLLPKALEAGLTAIAMVPHCAFTYGGYRHITEDGKPISSGDVLIIDGDAHNALVRQNLIVMHGAVLYRRDCLLLVNGFDESLRRAEDYDLYLRLTQSYPIISHQEIVAEYRKHGKNTNDNHVEMLKAALTVLKRHEARTTSNASLRAAFRAGRARVTNYRVEHMLSAASSRWHNDRNLGILVRDLIEAARWSPWITTRNLVKAIARRIMKALPRTLVRLVHKVRRGPHTIPLGLVCFGDLKRLLPIDFRSGWSRGTPIDRYYIEGFLALNAADIHGRVLELADNAYTRRFGGDRVAQSDVLALEATNPLTTIVGDISRPNCLDENVFDCIIFTQALQYVYDLDAGIESLYRALKPGGVLLVTTPGITKKHDKQWPWYWAFTEPAIFRLLADRFGSDFVTTEAHGNVFAATGFLHGIAFEELDAADLNVVDENYPIIIAARATKAKVK